MKRLLIVLAVVAVFGVVGITSVNASDRHYAHGYRGDGHASYGRTYSHLPPSRHHNYEHGRASHGRTYGHQPPSRHRGYDYGRRYDRHHSRYRYGGHSYPRFSYSNYGHGDVHITTPHFGLRIGH
jgi:hypothetical protein